MSRPFSYNDENFTVIGNVLFCHIEVKKEILKNESIVEIPPAIYARMLFTSQTFYQVLSDIGNYTSYPISIGVKEIGDKKYFLFCNYDITILHSYIVGYYILKDI